MKWEKNTVTLVGDPSLVHSKISLKAMLKTVRKEKQGFWVKINEMEKTQNGAAQLKHEVPAYLQSIVQQHDRVFTVPVGLPPVRGNEHAINLKEGSNPVGTRPYRYPQSQKDEIERLIQDMLKAGIIKPSKCPYSSPVLLVKKKMGHGVFVLTIGL